MVATPQYCAFFFRGKSGKTYSVDGYVSDVNGARITWDGGSGAGTTSPTFWKPPEDVVLEDYSMVTGTADTEKIRLVVNGRPMQQVLRYVPHLTTNASRPKLSIGFAQNVEISAFQISD